MTCSFRAEETTRREAGRRRPETESRSRRVTLHSTPTLRGMGQKSASRRGSACTPTASRLQRSRRRRKRKRDGGEEKRVRFCSCIAKETPPGTAHTRAGPRDHQGGQVCAVDVGGEGDKRARCDENSYAVHNRTGMARARCVDFFGSILNVHGKRHQHGTGDPGFRVPFFSWFAPFSHLSLSRVWCLCYREGTLTRRQRRALRRWARFMSRSSPRSTSVLFPSFLHSCFPSLSCRHLALFLSICCCLPLPAWLSLSLSLTHTHTGAVRFRSHLPWMGGFHFLVVGWPLSLLWRLLLLLQHDHLQPREWWQGNVRVCVCVSLSFSLSLSLSLCMYV